MVKKYQETANFVSGVLDVTELQNISPFMSKPQKFSMLGVFHRKPWHPSPAVREEIRQLDKRIEQYEFLMNRDTRTLAQLRDLRAQTEAEVRKLNAERNRLYKTNPESDQIPLFTQRLRELRKTIKLCKRIEEHSLEIAQRQEEEQKRRAEQERRNAYERNTMETSAPIRP